MDIISREDAFLAGKPRFFTGIPCKNGHVAERYVTQGQCLDCLKKFKKFAPNPYTSELVPWNPEMFYVPRVMSPEQYEALQLYLGQCVEAWVHHNGLASGNISLAYAKRREYFTEKARKEAEHAATMLAQGRAP